MGYACIAGASTIHWAVSSSVLKKQYCKPAISEVIPVDVGEILADPNHCGKFIINGYVTSGCRYTYNSLTHYSVRKDRCDVYVLYIMYYILMSVCEQFL